MESDPFAPVRVGGRTFNWYTISGRARHVRRYSVTRTTPGTDTSPQMTTSEPVTEFWIQTAEGRQTPVNVRWDLMIAEGQRVTGVYGVPDGRSTGPWLVLVNHDAQSSHYLLTPKEFFQQAGMLAFPPGWLYFALCVVGFLSLAFLDAVPALSRLAGGTVLGRPLVSFTPLLLVGLVDLVQRLRARRLWTRLTGPATEMAGHLTKWTEHWKWPDP